MTNELHEQTPEELSALLAELSELVMSARSKNSLQLRPDEVDALKKAVTALQAAKARAAEPNIEPVPPVVAESRPHPTELEKSLAPADLIALIKNKLQLIAERQPQLQESVAIETADFDALLASIQKTVSQVKRIAKEKGIDIPSAGEIISNYPSLTGLMNRAFLLYYSTTVQGYEDLNKTGGTNELDLELMTSIIDQMEARLQDLNPSNPNTPVYAYNDTVPDDVTSYRLKDKNGKVGAARVRLTTPGLEGLQLEYSSFTNDDKTSQTGLAIIPPVDFLEKLVATELEKVDHSSV